MNKRKIGSKKGFTLIELLVVIAIIAILSVVVVLTLNPAEMLRRSRDSNRASDLSMIKTSISLYLADVSSTNLGTPGTCYVQLGNGVANGTVYEFPSSSASENIATVGYLSTNSNTECGQWFSTALTANVELATSSRSVSGAGWIPVILTNISSGAPIGQWPADPAFSLGSAGTGNAFAGHFYSYIMSNTNNGYKLAAKMESALYSNQGSSDLESTDGGSDLNMYEQGTTLTL
jgi:prepilin-type N-terminal cleavage/methylation domain-containing protein